MSATMQVTIIAKSGGPLTKRISLAAKLVITSEVAKVHGTCEAQRVSFRRRCDRAQRQEFSTPIVEPVRARDPKVFG